MKPARVELELRDVVPANERGVSIERVPDIDPRRRSRLAVLLRGLLDNAGTPDEFEEQ